MKRAKIVADKKGSFILSLGVCVCACVFCVKSLAYAFTLAATLLWPGMGVLRLYNACSCMSMGWCVFVCMYIVNK